MKCCSLCNKESTEDATHCEHCGSAFDRPRDQGDGLRDGPKGKHRLVLLTIPVIVAVVVVLVVWGWRLKSSGGPGLITADQAKSVQKEQALKHAIPFKMRSIAGAA